MPFLRRENNWKVAFPGWSVVIDICIPAFLHPSVQKNTWRRPESTYLRLFTVLFSQTSQG